MSLLMDALRKAEEAKKKAELESKSKPVVATPAADTADASSDIEIEFDAPAISEPAIAEPLLEDLAARIESRDAAASTPASTANIAAQAAQDEPEIAEESADASGAGVQAESWPAGAARGAQARDEDDDDDDFANAEQADAVEAYTPPPTRPTPDYTRPASFIAPRPAAGTATRDAYSIDFAPVPPAPAPAEPETRATPRAASTLRLSTHAPSAEVLDTSLEEQDRKSARSVFAAKRNASPLKQNLQLTALSIAAVLLVAIGIYFYINLRTGSGIGSPGVDFEYQQAQRQFTEAELEMADAELGIAQVETAIAELVVPEISAPGTAVGLPNNVADAAFVQPAVSDTDDTVDTDATEPSPAAQPAPEPPAVATAPAVTAPPVTAPSVSATPVTAPAVATNGNNSTSPSTAGIRDNAPPAASASAAATLQPQSIEPETLVSFTRRATTPTGNPVIENAYSAYQSGNLELAERLYRDALAAAPLNRSALLGLAAIAANRNDTVAALELYSRLLARDPADPVAKAGILEIMPSGNLQQQEAELRRLQSQHPDIAPLAYAFGNFLASQQRWSEAQQAYFSALQLAKNDAQGTTVNPDYAFNLAVSLEHLGQPRAAGNYYREALTLAESHPAGFSLGLARERLNSTETASNE